MEINLKLIQWQKIALGAGRGEREGERAERVCIEGLSINCIVIMMDRTCRGAEDVRMRMPRVRV